MQFHMSEWPLHTTLADVFAIDRQVCRIDELFASKLLRSSSVETAAIRESVLGHNTSPYYSIRLKSYVPYMRM